MLFVTMSARPPSAPRTGTVFPSTTLVRSPTQTGPGFTPGGEVLLRVDGWPNVQRVFEAIDTVDALGIDPADAAPDHWRHVHNRLAANENPRPYTLERHRDRKRGV